MNIFRFMGGSACIFMGLEEILRALGSVDRYIMFPDHSWINWIFVFVWFAYGIRIFIKGTD